MPKGLNQTIDKNRHANNQTIGSASKTELTSLGLVVAKKIRSAPYMESRSAIRLGRVLFFMVSLLLMVLYFVLYNVFCRGKKNVEPDGKSAS